MKTLKPVKIIIFLIALAFGMQRLVHFIFSGDPIKQEIEKYVSNDADVLEKIGAIQELSLSKRVSVEASSQQAAYSTYMFHVKAKSGNARITVRVDQPEKPSGHHYTITSFAKE